MFKINALHIRPLKTGKITNNIYIVNTLVSNFYIYKKYDDLICLDSGFRKGIIKKQLRSLNIDPNSISHMFLTHSDFDHAGGVGAFEQAKIYISSHEVPMISGEHSRLFGFRNSSIKKEYITLNDGDIINVGEIKITAIATRGHTPGSMSYLIDDAFLFVGDTFKILDDKKIHPLRNYINISTEQQIESLQKLARLENIEFAFTAHTGYTDDFFNAIANWR